MKLRRKQIKAPGGKKFVIRQSRWFAPYVRKPGQKRLTATLPFITRSNCGVYIIRSKRTKKILYVGHSAKQLQKTLSRHFQDWSSSKQYRATYPGKFDYEVMVVLTGSCGNAFMLEQYFHHTLRPRDGKIKLEVPLSEIRFTGLPNPKKVAFEEVAPF